MRRQSVLGGIAVVVLVSAVLWLRDPAWLSDVESGFGPWLTDGVGIRYRWTGGRASFFVAASASEIRIPVRTGRDTEAWPVVVTISIDDRIADRLTLTRKDWYLSRLMMPRRGSRRVRRVDIHADRTLDGSRGVQIGDVQVIR